MTLYVRYRERMTRRPRAGLSRIVEDLGSSLLDVVASPGPLGAEVTGVHIYDPLDELLVPPGGILLAVGVQGAEPIRALLEAAGPAAAVVVKQPVAVDDAVRAAVERTGVALLGLTRAASWAQVAALLRALLAEGDLSEPGDGTSDDLFSLANAVCALLDAPVTIEDRSSRVLAYSGRQDEADHGRIATGLGVPIAALFDHPAAPPSPVSRREDRTPWRDPQSGYVRRNISPAGFPSPIQIVEVVLPAGARVAYETAAHDPAIHQQIWVQEGSLEVTLGNVTYRLSEDDCLAMRLEAPTAFHNRTRKPVRYIVVLASERPRGSRR